ncbi:hypothetical protein BC826DRAFT_1110371 [Russula brevipes]|nr:hypothetical protein BC826DRAFT_1110371 [Russula brevipes]
MEPFEGQQDFIKFLRVPEDRLPSNPPTAVSHQFTFSGFVESANAMAKSMRDRYFAKADLLVFKLTGNNTHYCHIIDTQCRPDYTAAFERHWLPDKKIATLWPCIRLVGAGASKGKTPKQQEEQAVSYLHCLLLARPDLRVAQGVLASNADVTFLFGIAGVGINSFKVSWEHKDLHRIMYAFLYRLYDPGDFEDPSYVEMVPDLKEKRVTYTVQITVNAKVNGGEKMNCPGFRPIYASRPFGTRTHVLSKPDSDVKVNGERLTVLKDQLCRVETRFDEHDILMGIHSQEKVPGVAQAAHHESTEVPFCQSRKKHLTGLQQTGKAFANISTLQQVLEIVFDVLEVLRYLRVECSILHRDISKGNVLYMDVPPSSTRNMLDAQANETAELKEVPLCFIKFLLDESIDPRQTSALLIDFNYAEDLREKQGLEHKRTGTPIFIARAVEMGKAVRPPLYSGIMPIPEVPKIPEPYSRRHPERIKKFPPMEFEFKPPSEGGTNSQFRHELDHDAESVFWLLLYWVVRAQPRQSGEESIDPGTWANLIGSANARNNLLRANLQSATHSAYRPLAPLLDNLAAMLVIDRHWLEESDPRNNPEYLLEAFQRLILQFILEHRNEPFMKLEVARNLRRPEETLKYFSPFHTSSSDTFHESLEKVGKYLSPPLSSPQRETKRPRIDASAEC